MRDATPTLYGFLQRAFVKRKKIKIIIDGEEFHCLLWKLSGSSYVPQQKLIDFSVQAISKKNIKPVKKVSK